MMGKYTSYEKYKDSGIGWLGEVPEHWEVRKAKHLFSLICEQAPANNDHELLSIYTAIGVRPRRDLEARGNKATTTDNYWIVKKKDIIVNKLLAWMGAIGISEYDGVTSPAYDILRSKNGVNPYFYNYLFRSPFASSEFKKNSTGIMEVRLRLYFSEFGNIYFPHPSLEEQIAIARFLDYKLSKINRFIRKKKQLIQLLNEQKAAIINQAVTKGLDPNAPMKDSGVEWLGEIPEHWEVRRLKFLIRGKLKYGANEPGGNFILDAPRYIRITDFDNNGNLKSNTICSLEFTLAEPYLLKEGDILFARSGGTVGKTFQFKNYNGQACYAGYLIKAEPNLDKILSDYLFIYTNSGVYNQWKNFIFNKATIENIGADKYANLPVIVPKPSEQHQIVTHIETETALLTTAISKIEKEIALVEEYKTALIAEAVTGKIDVRGYVVPEMDVETWHAMSPEEEEELSMAAEDAAEYQTEETK